MSCWLPATTTVGHAFDPRTCPPLTHCTDGMRVGEVSDSDKQMVRGALWTTVLAFGGGLALLYVALKGARL